MQAMETAPSSGMPEADFLAMMILHHQGAQQVEIESMENRLELLRACRAPDVAADQALGGTRGDTQPAPSHLEHTR